MKSRGGLGREVRFPLSPLPLPRFYFFALLFTLHRSPLSERLEQASVNIIIKAIDSHVYFALKTHTEESIVTGS